MYKVMLVDDEALILNGLKALIEWEELELSIENTALNGVEALQKFKENPVEIVVTDITMPKMNGLELIKKIKEIDSGTKFIILSGYDEFSYAKQAIALGIENYILKPINEEELEATLVNIINKIKVSTEVPVLEGKKLEILRENILYRWVINSISINELEERDFILGLSLNLNFYTAAVLKLYNEMLQPEDIYSVYSYIKSETEQWKNCTVFRDLHNNIIFLKGGSLEECNYLKEQMEALVDKLMREKQINSFVTVGSTERGSKNVSISYDSAVILQDYVLIYGYNKVVTYSEYNKKYQSDNAKVDIEEFNKLVLSKDINAIEVYIDNIFNTICSYENVTPDFIQNTAIRMLNVLNRINRELKLSDENGEEDLKKLILYIFNSRSTDEIKNKIIEKSIELISKMQITSNKLSPIIQQVVSYVKNNYSEEISLKTLGFKYNINPSYLGQIFNKEVGEPFSEFLNRIRNEKAKDLLLNTNMKINDIADEIGYIDASYFYRKFKEHFGVSPNTMRSSKNYQL